MTDNTTGFGTSSEVHRQPLDSLQWNCFRQNERLRTLNHRFCCVRLLLRVNQHCESGHERHPRQKSKRPTKAHDPSLEKLLIQFLFRFETSVSESSDHSRDAITAPRVEISVTKTCQRSI